MCSGGLCGMPWGLVLEHEAALSFAEAGGWSRKACAGDGFAGSRGGAFILDLGIEAIGCE